jgi:hypothetical protein
MNICRRLRVPRSLRTHFMLDKLISVTYYTLWLKPWSYPVTASTSLAFFVSLEYSVAKPFRIRPSGQTPCFAVFWP